MFSVAGATALVLASSVLVAGCGEQAEREPAPEPARTPAPERAPQVERARCPAGATDCVSATGTILYVERVDPDGDGDAHFVLLDSKGVTAPGITIVDVRADLRPKPLPGLGDELSAAGPVHRGSYGQRQIEAVAVSAAP